MKIFELFEQGQSTITAPGNVVPPTPASGKPSGSVPVPNTEQKPNTSNTPQTNQPTGFPPSTSATGSPITPAPVPPNQQIGQTTSQPVPPVAAGQAQVPGQAPDDASVQQPGQQPATVQDLQSQMQSLMTKLRQIQTQEPPPESLNSQPGVSG